MLAGTSAAGAATIPLGAATGGVGVYYNNNGGGEVPSNLAFLRAQFSAANTNGSVFNFDASPLPGSGGALSWNAIFQSVPNQFGLDIVYKAPTTDNSVVTPVLTAYDNGNNSLPGRIAAGPVTWAVDNYTGPTTGPSDPANSVINSLFRGGTGANDGIALTVSPVSQVGTVFTVSFSAELDSDNLVHWYTVSTPDTPVAAFELTGRFFVDGSLSYDSATDANPLMDFYAGSVIVRAEVICGARYVSPAGTDVLPGPVPNTCRNSMVPCRKVQQAVDVACPGDTVNLAAGLYPEQVTIAKAVTVQGAGATLSLIQPTSVTQNTTSITSGDGLAVIVLVRDTTGVLLKGVGVDGGPAAFNACAPGYVGVYFRNATGEVRDAKVTNIFLPSAPGCQTQLGIVAHSGLSGTTDLTVRNTTVDHYGKNGITCSSADVTCTITDNVVRGRGPVTLGDAAQNGIQLSSGAGGSVVGNTVENHFYSAPPPNIDYCATGIFLYASDPGTQVQGNTLSGNRCQLYVYADDAVVQGNDIEPANEFPVTVIGSGNAFSLNRVIGSTNAASAAVYVDGIDNTFSCNRVSDNAGGAFFVDSTFSNGGASGPGVPNQLTNNAIEGNGVGVDASALDPGGADIAATGNWWGCVAGPGNPGCDSVTGAVNASAPLSSPPACLSCTTDAECNDGLACSGTETCNLMSNICVPGTPVTCATDQCKIIACAEPSGTCVATNKINGFACTDGDVCTTFDTCQGGTCVGSGGSDDDGDGYCNAQEVAAGCNPNDFLEIPPQANVYSGGKGSTGGEVLLAYRAPGARKVIYGTEGSCAGTPQCSLVSGFCLSGKVGDPCATNADCAHTNSCRVVINYAETPDLVLDTAEFKARGQQKQNVATLFSPVTPGCSRKVDLGLAPGFHKATLRLKASGTSNGRVRRDRDVVIYSE